MAASDQPASQGPVTTPTKRFRFIDYLSIVFGLTTVVGLVLAFYWHAESVQERLPRYYVSPERTRIIDTSVPVPEQLQVLYKGKDLKTNVSAAIVYLWNDGKLPIKAEDVLEPVSIQLDPDSEILDARLLKVSRPVTKFAKGGTSESAKNSLPVSFSILERSDGAALQIIYTGKPDTAISIKGTILGAGEPRILAPDEKNFEASARRKTLRFEFALGYVLLTLGGVFFGGVISFESLYKLLSNSAAIPLKRKIRGGVLLLAATALSFLGAKIDRSATAQMAPAVPQSIWMRN